MGLNILILAAGGQEENTKPPAYLSEYSGRTALELIFEQLSDIDAETVSICLDAHDIIRYHAKRVARLISPNVKVFQIERQTGGSGCTALLAACQLAQDNELLIVSANELIKADIAAVLDEFRLQGFDGGLLCFSSLNPRYSFVKLDESGQAVEVSQRNPISKNATAGLFWYKTTAEFVRSAKQIILKDNKTDGLFFVAPAYNEMILSGQTIGVKSIENELYIPLKDTDQLRDYQRKMS